MSLPSEMPSSIHPILSNTTPSLVISKALPELFGQMTIFLAPTALYLLISSDCIHSLLCIKIMSLCALSLHPSLPLEDIMKTLNKFTYFGIPHRF